MSEIRVDNITDEAGTGSPSLPNGLVTPSAAIVGSNIQLDSNGISFDSGSNYLDDYEEGTFTPVLEGNTDRGTTDSNNINLTISNVLGRYVKIGPMVYWSTDDFSVTDNRAAVLFKITNLPFAVGWDNTSGGVAAVTDHRGINGVFNNNVQSDILLFGDYSYGTNVMRIFASSLTDPFTMWGHVIDASSSKRIAFGGFYRVD